MRVKRQLFDILGACNAVKKFEEITCGNIEITLDKLDRHNDYLLLFLKITPAGIEITAEPEDIITPNVTVSGLTLKITSEPENIIENIEQMASAVLYLDGLNHAE